VKKWSFKAIAKEIVTTLVLFFIISVVVNYIREPDINQDAFCQYLAKYQEPNKPLVVHFWATWCPTCKLEASNIERISKNHNVITVAVNSGSDKKIDDFMKEHELTYRVINDSSGALAKKFGIDAYPTTLIYDKDGKLKFAEVGYSSTLGLQARLELSN
jgi:thiol-disulfide isomerase/thioredoxin